ncbi:GP179 protein, partial [Hemiprocne comata]|nr:GP179 protein [Hemiprocne comata]
GVAEGGRKPTHPPPDHAEVEQPHAKPTAGRSRPSTAGAQGTAAEELGAEVCPREASGIPAGKGALLRQEAVVSREDSGVPLGEESPAKVLEKSSSQPEPLGPRGSWGVRKVPPRSWSVEVAPLGTAGRAEVCPGESQADSSIKTEICPWKGREGSPGKGGSKGGALPPGEEPGMEKPPAASEKVGSTEGRRAEVCPWETREGESTVRAEICPWDMEGRQLEEERQQGGRRLLAKGGSSQQGAPSPGEVVEQPSTGLTGKNPPLLKASSKQAGTIDSKKANVCPWEVMDEPLPKTEICPWEEPAAPLGKEKPGQDTCGTSTGEKKPGSGGLEDTKGK